MMRATPSKALLSADSSKHHLGPKRRGEMEEVSFSFYSFLSTIFHIFIYVVFHSLMVGIELLILDNVE